MSSKVKTVKSKTSVSKKTQNNSIKKSNNEKDSEIKKEIKLDSLIQVESASDNSNQLFANRLNSRILSNYETDYRDILTKYDVAKNITRPRMTQYEKALVLGKRATQISTGAKPNITVKVGMTVVEIATEELRQQKVPFILKRPIGNRFEYWKIKDLIVNLE